MSLAWNRRWSPRPRALALLAAVALVGLACAPTEGAGQCTQDSDCTTRGTECDSLAAMCVDKDIDYTTTAEASPPANFTDKVIPFFRGQVCTSSNLTLQGGATIPLTLRPCVHPCITSIASPSYYHQWYCFNSSCDALTAMYARGDGLDCPAEAWGQFDQAECQYPISQVANIGPIEVDGAPVLGPLRYEIPFFTNEDIDDIANFNPDTASAACKTDCGNDEGCLRSCTIKAIAYRYVQQADRTINFTFTTTGVTPPGECAPGTAGCACYDIGFD